MLKFISWTHLVCSEHISVAHDCWSQIETCLGICVRNFCDKMKQNKLDTVLDHTTDRPSSSGVRSCDKSLLSKPALLGGLHGFPRLLSQFRKCIPIRLHLSATCITAPDWLLLMPPTKSQKRKLHLSILRDLRCPMFHCAISKLNRKIKMAVFVVFLHQSLEICHGLKKLH